MDQITHDVRRANWLSIITECQQRPMNVTTKQWLADNGINDKAYYYWLRKFRREACDQTNLPSVQPSSEITFAEYQIPETKEKDLTQQPIATIHSKNVTFEISGDISESLLRTLVREVLHA